jgi:hypothetical protein
MKAANVGMYSATPGDALRVRWVQVRDATSDQHREPNQPELAELIDALQRYASTRATDG